MNYEDYKARYELHSKNIGTFDLLLENNKEKTALTEGKLASEKEKQDTLSAQADADPATADLKALEASDQEVGRLRELRTALGYEHETLTRDRAREDHAREQLQIDNPECCQQGVSEGLHPGAAPDSGPSGPGMWHKGAALGVAVIALGHEGYQTVHHAGGDSHSKQIHQPHTHEHHEYEPERRSQWTEQVDSPPPGGSGGGPGGGGGGPDGPGGGGSGPHTGGASFGVMPSPGDMGGGFYANTSVTTTVEGVGSGHATLAPPSEFGAQPPAGQQPPAALVGPKENEMLLITSDRENQKLLTDQRVPIPEGGSPDPPSPPGAAAQGIPPPADDVPAKATVNPVSMPENEIER